MSAVQQMATWLVLGGLAACPFVGPLPLLIALLSIASAAYCASRQ